MGEQLGAPSSIDVIFQEVGRIAGYAEHVHDADEIRRSGPGNRLVAGIGVHQTSRYGKESVVMRSTVVASGPGRCTAAIARPAWQSE